MSSLRDNYPTLIRYIVPLLAGIDSLRYAQDASTLYSFPAGTLLGLGAPLSADLTSVTSDSTEYSADGTLLET